MNHDQLFIWKSSFGGPLSWVGMSLWGSPELGNVSQADGVSDMTPSCQLCGSVEGGLRKGTMQQTLLVFLSGRELSPSFHLDARHFSSSLNATGAFQAATLVLELRGSE